jgi:hypothetical protein
MFNKKFVIVPLLAGILVIPLLFSTSISFAADTTMTLTVTGGGLNISAPASIAFGSITSGATATVTMGSVTVTDLRGVAAGGVWVTTAIATPLTKVDLSSTIQPNVIGYAAGSFTHTGTVTLAKTDASDLTSAFAVVSASAITGGNSASWTPTMTVDVPIGTPNGAYSGSVTQSVA